MVVAGNTRDIGRILVKWPVERLFVVIIVRWQILIATTVATKAASKATSGSAETATSAC